jgi:hypothetical protein
MQIITDFKNEISNRQGFNLAQRRLTPRNRSVYELSGKINCLLSLHFRSARPYRWGVTANIIDKLKTQNKPWGVVLFFESHNTGYLLSSADVLHYIDNEIWPLADDGDYKPAAPGSYLARNKPFNSIDDFLSELTHISGEQFSIKTAIEEAKREASRIHRHGCVESEAHKKLKRYVAENPSCIGLNSVLSAFQEYIFPCGDKVDVAFESADNHWTVIEIELEGLVQNLIGLFQAVKYKALKEAVLKSKDLQGVVDGFLVANSIPSEVQALAGVLGVRTAEIKPYPNI